MFTCDCCSTKVIEHFLYKERNKSALWDLLAVLITGHTPLIMLELQGAEFLTTCSSVLWGLFKRPLVLGRAQLSHPVCTSKAANLAALGPS